jgi:hypothetical protein
MRWLLHGPMTPAVGDALRRHEHKASTMDEVGLPTEASPAEVLRLAHKAQLDVLTTDQSLAEAPFLMAERGDGSPYGRTIVYLSLEGGDVEQDDAIDRLFDRYKRLSRGRLYTVTGSRVKVRQLPGGQKRG